MKAIDVITRLVDTSLPESDLRYCFVDENKHPFTSNGLPAHPNIVDDFVELDVLATSSIIDNYAGVGISIQASNVCAIDVDHCFSEPNNIESGDDRAKYLLDLFKDAYCEFSFSGTGLRILFRTEIIENYTATYYIKNEKYKIEYYQPAKSFRYVTITGNTIRNNNLKSQINFSDKVKLFLNKYMIRPIVVHKVQTEALETRTFEELMKIVKYKYRTDMTFQNLWFNNAPGSGKDESERDYHLVAYLYENVTQDHDLIKQIFEQSNFFKTKDWKHICKWTNQDGRYYEYLYDNIRRTR